MDAILKMQYMLESFGVDSIYSEITLKIMKNISVVKRMNIAQLADFCQVSQGTISKYVRALNYDSFHSFRIGISEAVIIQESGKLDINLACDNIDENILEFFHSLTKNALIGIHSQDLSAFTKAAEAIDASSRVIVASESVFPTTYLISILLQTGKDVQLVKSWNDWNKLCNFFRKDDLIITFLGGNDEWDFLPSIPSARKAQARVLGLSSDINYTYGDQIDFLLKYDASYENDMFIRELYIRILISEYKKILQSKQS